MDRPEHIPVSPEVSDLTIRVTADASSPTRNDRNKPLLLRMAARSYQWFQENTFAPDFLKGAIAHPALGYLVALVFQLAMSLGIFALVYAYPSFRFLSVALILVILLVALGWGAGPGIVALLVGMIMLLIFILPPSFSLSVRQTEDVVGLAFYVIAGLAISILASNTERARRASEQLRLRLDTIIDAIPDSLTIYDAEGRRVQQNRVAREIDSSVNPPLTLAQIASQLQTRHSSGELLPPEDLPLARALRGEVVVGAELLYRVPVKQQDRLVAISAAPLYAPSGKTIDGVVTITHDLDERKQIENTLRASEEQERLLSEVSKLLTSTLDYQEMLANIARLIVPQLADWFAVDLVDADGRFELIEIDHKDPEQAQWARALREKYPVDTNTPAGLPNVVRTGQAELYPGITDEMLIAGARNEEEPTVARQVGYTSLMLVPLVARGKTTGVVTFVSAESGRKYNERDLALAEEIGRRAGVALDNARLYREVKQTSDQLSITLAELWRSRQQLEVIFANIADGISVQDGHGKLILINEAGAKSSGYLSVEDALEAAEGHTLRTHAEQRFEILDEYGNPISYDELPGKRALRGEKTPQAIVQYYDRVTQARRWSLVKAQPLIDTTTGRVELAITIFSDITESFEVQQRKDEFISMASHELKTPVTSLKGFTQVLQRRLLKQGDEQGLHYLNRMDAQLNRLTRLVGDLLDVSKMQAGKLTLDIESFELDALVQETVENVQATTSTHEIIVEGRTGGCILGDRDRLGQVFINLLTNAVKYSPRADKVTVHLSRKEHQAIMNVQDFGIGIDASHHQKIFERFYQVTDPEERTYPGLGMGLYISSEIVERHHGRMWVESRKGQGSTFSVALPLIEEG